MSSCRKQGGYLLVTVVVTLFMIASIAVLLSQDSSISANTANSELEAARADYAARAGMQHALWRTTKYACSAETNIPTTSLGKHSYTATATSAASTNAFIVNPDKDTQLDPANPKSNYGKQETATVKNDPPNSLIALYHFDLSSVAKGTRIASATAWFYVDDNDPYGNTEVRSMDLAWTETGATWENAGAGISNTVYGMLPSQDSQGVWVNVNLTALAQSWVNEPTTNHGLALSGTSDKETAKYTTREWSTGNQRPYLQVTVADTAVSPVVLKATGTLANGVERTLTRPSAVAYQPPNVVTLQLGTDPGGDTLVDLFYERNYGGSDYLQINNDGGWIQRPLLRFDLGAVPPGAKVISAQLELRKWSVVTPGSATIHRLTQSFVEGTRNGGGVADGATWATYNGSTNWTSPGGDRDPAPAAEAYIDTSGDWVSWDIGPLVDAWVNGEPNNGLLIEGSSGLKQAKFASRENSDATVHPRLTVTYACKCDSPCMPQVGSGNILMVVRDATNMWYYDIQKKAILESWGYTVNIIDDDASQADYDTGVAANDVAYISEPVRETSLNAKLSNASIGVVSDEGRMNDEFGIAASFATPVLGKAINVSDTSHYITQVFPIGPLDIYTADMEGLTVAGTEAPELRTLADWGGAASLVALETGAMTVSGGSSPGRRVMLPFGRQVDSNLDWSRLNSSGLLIAQRAIEWAMGAKKASAGNKVLLVVGDTANLTVEQADKKVLMEGWGHTVTLIATSASQAEFDAAADAVDVVYIPELGAGPMGELGTKADDLPKGVITEEARRAIKLGAFTLLPFVDTTSINIVDNTHYITETLPTGDVVLSTSTQSFWKLGGALAPDLHILGELTGGVPGLAYVDAGETVNDGNPAAGRRIKLPWGSYNFDVNLLTDDALDIMQRAIEWGGTQVSTLPLAHWKLDETSGTTATDSVGGNDGTLVNWPASPDWVAGRVDGGLSFDGSDDYIDVSSMNPMSYDDFTISAWYRSADLSVSDDEYIFVHDDSFVDEFVFGPTDDVADTLRLGLNRGGSWDPHYGTSDIVDQQWHHLAAVRAGGRVKLYVDGVEETDEADALAGLTVTIDGDGPFIGDYPGVTEQVHGTLDDVRFYDRGLSAEEIAELAAPSLPTPIAHWKLDDGTGLTAVDSEGGHDGTLTNGPAWIVGQLGDALEFDGSNDTVVVPDDDFWTLSPTMSRTWALWIKPVDLSVSWQSVWAQTNSSTRGFGIVAHSSTGSNMGPVTNGISVGWDESATQKLGLHSTNNVLTEDSWNHVAVTHDGSQPYANRVRIYVNGADVTDLGDVHTSGTLNGIDVSSTAFGGNPVDVPSWFRGGIDDVRVYDQVLTGADIAALAAMGTGGGGGGGGGSGSCFADDFESNNYSGTSGSIDWQTSWVEFGDDNSSNSGDERIQSESGDLALRVRDNNNGGEGVYRDVDLSGFSAATLTLEFRRHNLDTESDWVAVQVSSDAGETWSLLGEFHGPGSDDNYQTYSHAIVTPLTATSRIRLITSPTLGGTDAVYFDNIEICDE